MNSTGRLATIAQREEEQELLAEVLQGRRLAWNEFRRRYDNLVVGCVLRVLRRYGARHTNADLADLVSEVWVALVRDDYRRLRLYDPDRGYRLTSWLGLISTNTTIDQLRVRQAEPAYLEDMTGAERFMVDDTRPDARLEVEQSALLARHALSQLSNDEQQFVMWCYHDERAPAEMAVDLGVTINTIYSRKFKVREKLTRIMSQLTGTESDALSAGIAA